MLKNFKKYFPLAALVCGIIVLVTIFLPVGSWGPHDYSGLQVAFGDSDEYLEFSFLNTLAYVLAIAGGALAFLGAKSNNKMMKFVAIGCFVLSAILFFCFKKFVQLDGIGGSYAKEIRKQFDFEIGAILGAIFGLVGAAVTVADVMVKDE